MIIHHSGEFFIRSTQLCFDLLDSYKWTGVLFFIFLQSCHVRAFTQTVTVVSSRTALILGCEFGCKDAVEVLLKNGADVNAVDSMGHDAFHYARLNRNQELIALIKSYLDKANRGQNMRRPCRHLFEINIRTLVFVFLTIDDNSGELMMSKFRLVSNLRLCWKRHPTRASQSCLMLPYLF